MNTLHIMVTTYWQERLLKFLIGIRIFKVISRVSLKNKLTEKLEKNIYEVKGPLWLARKIRDWYVDGGLVFTQEEWARHNRAASALIRMEEEYIQNHS